MKSSKRISNGWIRAMWTLLPLVLMSSAVFGTGDQKFFSDDPIEVEPESQDASRVTPWQIDLVYDLVRNQFARPGEPAGRRAQNINTIDEVPDSSWFTNRILARPVKPEEAARGATTGTGPAPGVWTVIQTKTEGDAPGFTVRDSTGETWFLQFDPKSHPEGATAAALIANRIFWTLGYFQAEYYLSDLRPDQLQIGPDATFTPPSGKKRSLKLKDLQPVLNRVARKPDGSYRVLASRLLPGKILGGFRFYGTRPDDPNDVVPHENRRELRALQVFGAWTNLVDMKALNTMDTLITENGRARVRHYLLDVGSTFGMGANGPREWTEGHEYLFEGDKLLKRLVTFGAYLQPWQTVSYQESKAIGRFEGDRFEPQDWKTRVPVSAVVRSRDDDNFWAARRVMAFSDVMVRVLVKTGQLSDPAAEELLAETLIKRRNKIGQVYLTGINPLVNFSLDPSGRLTFENSAVKSGIARAPASYAASWSDFDNRTGAMHPLGETTGSGESVPVVSALPDKPGSFVVVEVRAIDPPHASWSKPVRTTFYKANTGWKLVGLERLEEMEAQIAQKR
jgi:hypothetical protein